MCAESEREGESRERRQEHGCAHSCRGLRPAARPGACRLQLQGQHHERRGSCDRAALPQLQCFQLGHPRSDQDQEGISRKFESKETTDAALQALVAGCGDLRDVRVSCCRQIGDSRVVLARGFRKLHHAIVSAPAVTDASFTALDKSCKWLKSLWAEGTFHDV